MRIMHPNIVVMETKMQYFFTNHWNVHPFPEQFYKEMLIFYFVIDRN